MTTTKTETPTEIIYEGDLILEEDFKTEKNLIVRGNISGKDGTRYNINARNIDAGNIDAGNIDARNIDAGDIDAWNIDAWNIDARNIDAGDIDVGNIVCETRTNKSKLSKTKARIYIKNRSQIERKEYDD